MSVSILDSEDLLPFCIITGKNGTGKSQFLAAIKLGHVQMGSITQKSTTLVTHKDFIFTDSGVINRPLLEQQKQERLNSVREVVSHIRSNNWELKPEEKSLLKQVARKKGISIYEIPDTSIDSNLNQRYRTYTTGVQGFLEARDDSRFNLARMLVLKGKEFIEDLATREFIMTSTNSDEFDREIIPSQLSSIIFDYRYQVEQNNLHEYLNKNKNRKLPVLTDEAFEEHYGPKPWVLINDLLSKFSGFRYKLDFNEDEFDAMNADYRVQFLPVDSSAPKVYVQPDQLSSGEQTILAFVSSLFAATRNLQFPKLLLLDEIDATLHPSMCTAFVNAIQEILVKKHGVRVIFVTHSPSTVASSPSDAIYLMDVIDGVNQIRSSTKENALAELSSGYVGITEEQNKMVLEHRVALSSRPMAFFEGPSDVIYFKAAIDKLEPELSNKVDLDSSTGHGGLNTLFNALKGSSMNVLLHGRKSVLVYDCDAPTAEDNYTHVVRFKLEKIEENPINKGVENLITSKMIQKARAANSEYFHESQGQLQVVDTYKVKLAEWIVANAEEDTFALFAPAIERIQQFIGIRKPA